MRQARTLLEQKIREQRRTLEEFVEYAEQFAREHGEPGTLSLRHLQRLASGRGRNGQPLGPVRAATARLLEHIFELSIDELLAAPTERETSTDSGAELRQRIQASHRVDSGVLALLHDQLMTTRRLDRQLGAVVAHEEVQAKIGQVRQLFTHSLTGGTRERLAILLAELHALAGWQALDLGNVMDAWQHYEDAKKAALESGSTPHVAHATAEQAFVLLDIGETRAAVDMLAATRENSEPKCSPLLRSWLAAAHGEALAAGNEQAASLHAFDTAAEVLPSDSTEQEGPYVALDTIHLARWRGHALARFGNSEAVNVLVAALDHLDPSFTRAETALRVDLAVALTAIKSLEEANLNAALAAQLATNIGSTRQQRRMHTLLKR